MISADGNQLLEPAPVDASRAARDIGSRRQQRLEDRRRTVERGVCGAAMAIVGAVIALGFWPGRMNADTLNQIDEARRGVYTDRHAPILQALWHSVFGIGVTPEVILMMQILLFIGGAFLVLRLGFGRKAATTCACLIALFPPVMGTIGLVGRDTWFAVLTVAGFGCVAAAAARRTGRARNVLLVLSLVIVWFGLASRQNAAPAVVIIAALAIGLFRYQSKQTPKRSHFMFRRVLGAIALAVLFVVVSMASQWVINRALNVRHFNQIATTQMYDLAALSRADGRNYFPPSVLRDRSMTTLSLQSSVATIIPLIVPGGPVRYPVTSREAEALNRAWVDQVKGDPLDYLRERARLFLNQVGISRDVLVSYHLSIDGNPWGYRTTFPSLNRVTNDYLGAFANSNNDGGWIYSVWVYMLAAMVLSVLLVLRRTWSALIVGGLVFASLTYEIGLFFGLQGAAYRYQFPGVAMTVVAVVGGLPLLIRGSESVSSHEFANSTSDPEPASEH